MPLKKDPTPPEGAIPTEIDEHITYILHSISAHFAPSSLFTYNHHYHAKEPYPIKFCIAKESESTTTTVQSGMPCDSSFKLSKLSHYET